MLTPKDAILFKIVHTCAIECLILTYIIWVVVVLRSPIHANEPSEYNGMLYRSSNRVLNNGIKVIILICMDGTSQYHHYHNMSRILVHTHIHTGQSRNGRTGLDDVVMDEVPVVPVSNAIPLVF